MFSAFAVCIGQLGSYPSHQLSFLSLTGSTSWFNIRIESVFSNKCPFVVTSPSYLLNRYNSTFFIWSLYFLKLSNWKVQLVPWHLQYKVWIPELQRLLALNFIAGISLAHELQQPWICQLSAGRHLFPCFFHWPGGIPPSLTSLWTPLFSGLLSTKLLTVPRPLYRTCHSSVVCLAFTQCGPLGNRIKPILYAFEFSCLACYLTFKSFIKCLLNNE